MARPSTARAVDSAPEIAEYIYHLGVWTMTVSDNGQGIPRSDVYLARIKGCGMLDARARVTRMT
jgi:hypothetical protein